MSIEHVALWTSNLEILKEFYVKYFGAVSGEKYVNVRKNFESYFLSFSTGPRLELMTVPGISSHSKAVTNHFAGLTHFAISVGSKAQVDLMTEQFRSDGFTVESEPRTTGDGYYESVILDPDGNRIELTV